MAGPRLASILTQSWQRCVACGNLPSMTIALLHRLPHLHARLLLHLLFKGAVVCVIAALLTYVIHRIFKLAGCALAAVFFVFCALAVVLKIGAAFFLHR